MISVYNLKPKFQQLLKPLLGLLHRANVSANQITIGAIFLSLIIGTLFWFGDSNRIFFLALPIGLFLRMALNALDGMMARTYQQQSKIGEIINELGDVISDLFIYFPLLKFEASFYVVAAFLCLTTVNEFSGVLAKVVSGHRRYDGPMGKSDRACLVGVYGLLCFFNIDISSYTYVIFLIVNSLLLVSTYLRIKRALLHHG